MRCSICGWRGAEPARLRSVRGYVGWCAGRRSSLEQGKEEWVKLTLDYSGQAGNFHWDDFVFTDLDRSSKSFRISDHYPLWCEFLMPDQD